MQIEFGSDGYRGVIGHTFTREAVTQIVLGCCEFIRRSGEADPGNSIIPIGYDTRFMARDTAHFAARLVSAQGLEPLVSAFACPSPYLAFATRHFESLVGIMVTASHNPAHYCGIKLKGIHGGSMMPGDAKLIQEYANRKEPAEFAGIPLVDPNPPSKTFDLTKQYFSGLVEAAGEFGNAEQYLVVDCMHGASAQLYKGFLAGHFNLNTTLRDDPDPLFGGVKPEPIPANLKELAARVGFDGHDSIGLAFDGDGDRLAVVDETGAFLESHEIYCLLLEHLVKNLGKVGPVVTTVSFSSLTRRVARDNGCDVYEVPVGFKSVSEGMLEYQAILGGEESGGTGIGHYLPERDALLMAIMLLGAKKIAGKSLNEMVAELYEKHGRSEFVHKDMALPEGLEPTGFKQRLRDLSTLDYVCEDEVQSFNHQDGMKIRTKDGWVLVRMSGTENIARIYAEAATKQTARNYAEFAAQFLELRELG